MTITIHDAHYTFRAEDGALECLACVEVYLNGDHFDSFPDRAQALDCVAFIQEQMKGGL